MLQKVRGVMTVTTISARNVGALGRFFGVAGAILAAGCGGVGSAAMTDGGEPRPVAGEAGPGDFGTQPAGGPGVGVGGTEPAGPAEPTEPSSGVTPVPRPAEDIEVVAVVPTQDGFALHVNGNPYFIRGAGGGHGVEALAAAGGNSLRTWGVGEAAETLDAAHAAGVSVTLGIWSLDEVEEAVVAHRDHPALLMWALGNEMETRAADPVDLWQQVERAAQRVKELDGDHPVITVVAEIGGGKLDLLRAHAPSLDAVGINTYGGIHTLAERVAASGWDKPYLVTEFGPIGHWEAQRTTWGVYVEPDSSAKASHYLRGYQAAVAQRPSCLGAYAFLWGHKQEKTHTWYGMWLPEEVGGGRLGAVDAMAFAWTGRWPSNRAPEVGPDRLRVGPEGDPGDGLVREFAAGSRVACVLDARDPEGEPLRVTWDLRIDATNHDATGGAFEPPTSAIAGAVVSSDGNAASIQLPGEAGAYRIHAYAHDGHGGAATASVAILVR